MWIIHYTLDEELRQVVIFENEKCSEVTTERCVLYTQQVAGTEDYILVGKVRLSMTNTSLLYSHGKGAWYNKSKDKMSWQHYCEVVAQDLRFRDVTRASMDLSPYN